MRIESASLILSPLLIFGCIGGSTDADAEAEAEAEAEATGDTGPPSLGSWDDSTVSAVCTTPTATFSAGAFADAAAAFLDMADTANVMSPEGNWYETHTLIPSSIDTAQPYTTFSTDLTLGMTLSSWVPGESSFFPCSDYIGDPTVMTYSLRLYASSGALIDCVAWGHDPQGFIDNISPTGDTYAPAVNYTHGGDAKPEARPNDPDFVGCRPL